MWINLVNPDYPYPNSLVTTILLAAKQQVFFAEHLPALSSLNKGKNINTQLHAYLDNLLFNSITLKNNKKDA
jgi:hypothetical protein